MIRLASLIALAGLAIGFAGDDTVVPVGKGVTPPKVLRKPDPKYSKEAERDHIQGTALYTLIVDRSGHPRDIELLSPIGYGLDEKGLEAIQQWVFAPGMKDVAPVNVRAQVEVSFRFVGLPFDEKQEKFRTEYNAAVHELKDPARKAKGLEVMRQLAAKNYAPAMAVVGEWEIEGREVPQDAAGGRDLVRRAAEKYDKEAMFYLGKLYEKGDGMQADPDKGLKLIRDSAMQGSDAARIYLGVKYANGQGVPVDAERARYYFRLCAAHNVGQCQLLLGRMLLQDGVKKDAVTAAAWLQLAQANSVEGAAGLAGEALRGLSEEDVAAVDRLKPQLIRR
jgi:TonB family protein